MVESPAISRNRLLTRTDSMRFFASKRFMSFAYGFASASILFMLFLVLNPSSYQLGPRIRNAFHPSRRYNFSTVLAHIFYNSSFSPPPPYTHDSTPREDLSFGDSTPRSKNNADEAKYHWLGSAPSPSQISRKEGSGLAPKEGLRRDGSRRGRTRVHPPYEGHRIQTPSQGPSLPAWSPSPTPTAWSPSPTTATSSPPSPPPSPNVMDSVEMGNSCDFYEGSWVRDDSYPLYSAGSCPFIDEPFNCFVNGRRDNMFEKYRWQPKNCNIPRYFLMQVHSINACWKQCNLRVDRDYNCSVEFFRSPFLVQEWETPDRKGSMKETLRLDLVERSCDKYKDADVLIFNTGHWWTHEKTTEGKGYYQEGDHIHGQLNVEEAIYKALTTWSQWIDANVDSKKTAVFFRGYSPSHFRGGEWNSGGQCENETEPTGNVPDLSETPPMMRTIETVIERMKTPVFYLNITSMTDIRRDAHPSLYRNENMTEETKKYMLTHQDCSHWCLPGVPDLWNELVYAHLLSRINETGKNPK
ncbi:hypothetical protein Fmac_022918 [Flemingia macrophylla]|uniref:Trichome birefringence-like N-terminal domain-containing protein n=1 Tax=Flemingia macrophylla TaxID=520843 RepID=A0ABD1LK14_9FABA